MRRVGLEADAEAPHDGHHGVVEGRLHAEPAAVLTHGAVEVVDLRPAATHDVLQEGRPAAAALAGDVGDVGEQFPQAPALVGVDEALGGNAVDRLHFVAGRTPHHDALGADVHADGRYL